MTLSQTTCAAAAILSLGLFVSAAPALADCRSLISDRFDTLDLNGSGSLDRSEWFADLLDTRSGAGPETGSVGPMANIVGLALYDADANGRVTEDELPEEWAILGDSPTSGPIERETYVEALTGICEAPQSRH